MPNNSQIPFSMRFDLEATFDNFYVPADSPNAGVVNTLRLTSANEALPSGAVPVVYVWGATGSGVSHLLQAVCQQAQQAGHVSVYLPLASLTDHPGQVLDSLDQVELLCLDDLQHVVGNDIWARALFNLFNQRHACGKLLVVGARCAPRELKVNMPDLATRLAWGLVYRLEALTEQDKHKALQMRASLKGLDLGDEVATFLIRHASREPAWLFESLELLDQRSLVDKRRLTIPFVKEVLGL